MPPRSRKRILETKERAEITCAIFNRVVSRDFLNSERILDSTPPLVRDATSRIR